MIEEYLVRHSSPTLAGIKASNLFKVPKNEFDEIFHLKNSLLIYGIDIEIMKVYENSLLIYVYRKKMLEEILKSEEVMTFLEGYGYYDDVDYINLLKSRLNSSNFPHEIGIFLGYPPQDVKNFIINKGQNYKICGYWKVYDDDKSSKKLFDKYFNCTKKFTSLFMQGKDILSLCAN